MFRGCTLEHPEPVAAAAAAAAAAAEKGEGEAGPIVVAGTAELAVAVL
jgi:2-keto-4-pentenoate hydratase